MTLLAVSPFRGPFPQNNLVRFYPAEIESVKTLCEIITKRAWSPVVFKDDYRANINFMFSDYLALDFDDWSLEKAREWLHSKKLKFIIGTTKSHTEESHCFRVIVPWSERLMSGNAYKQNILALAETLPIDKGSAQCSRMYQPCKRITDVHLNGGKFTWTPYVQPPRHPMVELARIVPSWVQEYLERGVSSGVRNATCYRIAANLCQRGFGVEEIVRIFVSSSIDLSEKEFLHVTRSAAATGRKHSLHQCPTQEGQRRAK
jgi:hypothetical protein